MLEEQLIREFGFDPATASELARSIAMTSKKPAVVEQAERERRIAALQDIAGTMRIEGLILTELDQRFHAYVYGLGVSDDDTDSLILAYAHAVNRRESAKALAAE